MVIGEIKGLDNKEINVSKKRKEIGLRIRDLREKKGLTQVDLANLIDSSQSHIANIEAGRRRLSYETLEKIAQALGVSVSELLEPHDETQPPRLEQIARKAKFLPVVAAVKAGRPGEPIQYRYTEKVYPYVGELECEDCFVLEVDGDSMEPTLKAGDYILVKPIEKYGMLFPENFENKIVVAATEDWEYTIKRLKKINNEYYLVPDNPRYEIQKPNKWKIVGVALERLPKPEKLY